MYRTIKYIIIGFQQFIVATIVLIFACDIDFRDTSDNLKDETCIENISGLAKKKPLLIKYDKKQNTSSEASHASEYFLKGHFNLRTLKLKNGTFQPAYQTPAVTPVTRSIRITQFDEL